jgi:hypothetical protein
MNCDGLGSILGYGRNFLFAVIIRFFLGPIQFPIKGVSGVLSQEIKSQEGETDRSQPSISEDKNGVLSPLP